MLDGSQTSAEMDNMTVTYMSHSKVIRLQHI